MKKTEEVRNMNLIVNDKKKAELVSKPFAELTDEDMQYHQSFLAKVYQDEFTVGSGRTKEIKKVWRCSIMLAHKVFLVRDITDDELYSISFFNPGLITPKAKVKIPVKCISGVTESGDRYYRVIACLCDNVYYGSSRKNPKNNGFLSPLLVNNIRINNALAETDPNLTKVEFIDVNESITSRLETAYAEELINSEVDF